MRELELFERHNLRRYLQNGIWEIIFKIKGGETGGGMWPKGDHACHARVGPNVERVGPNVEGVDHGKRRMRFRVLGIVRQPFQGCSNKGSRFFPTPFPKMVIRLSASTA